jgi:hypothetical protein
MDDTGWILALGAFCLVIALGNRMAKLEREIDMLVDGDTETLKLRRKLEGRTSG